MVETIYSSELTREQRDLITRWILGNPHAALELVVSTHAQRWYGCDCAIQKEVDRRKACGAHIIDVTNKEACDKVY